MGIQIKKFRAATLQKAIEDVRDQLGDDAIILQTNTVKETKGLGLLSKTLIEVTAAIDRKDEPQKNFHASEKNKMQKTAQASTAVLENPKRSWLNRLTGTSPAVSKQKTDAPVVSKPATVVTEADDYPRKKNSDKPINQLYAIKTFIEPLEKEISGLRTKLDSLTEAPKSEIEFKKTASGATRKRVFDPLEGEIQKLRSELRLFMTEKRLDQEQMAPVYRQLIHFWTSKGLSHMQVLSFLQQLEKHGVDLKQGHDELNAISDELATSVHEANVFSTDKQRIVVLVGATGVGKSTTIAKMAAYEKIRLKRSVSLVSIDDYKIGGVDQMGHYSRLLEIPFLKSRNDMSLEEQIKMATGDTIFVDTFGVSPNDTDRLEKLMNALKFEDPEMASRVEIHLVMPVGISAQDVEEHLERFSVLDPQYLIFTKWDETQNWGGMLAAIMQSQKPVSFVCHGQNVPDDMSMFSQKSFIETVTNFRPVGAN